VVHCILWQFARNGFTIELSLQGHATDFGVRAAALYIRAVGDYVRDGVELQELNVEKSIPLPPNLPEIPAAILTSGDPRRILPWEDIQRVVSARAAEERRKILNAVEQFRAALEDYEVTVDAAGGGQAGFFGVIGWGEAIGAYRLRIELAAFLPPAARARGRALLAAEAVAAVEASIFGMSGSAHASLAIRVSADAAIDLSLTILNPTVPHLRFDLPQVPLPQLDLSSLASNLTAVAERLNRVLRPIALPLPGIDVAVEWTPAPPTWLAKVESDRLSLSSSDPADGIIKVQGQEIARLHGFQVVLPPRGNFSIKGTLTIGAQGKIALPDTILPEALTGPVAVALSGIQLQLQGAIPPQPPNTALGFQLDIRRFEVRAKDDPEAVFTFEATFTATAADVGAPLSYELTSLKLIEPQLVDFMARGAEFVGDAAYAVLRFVQEIRFANGQAQTGEVPETGIGALLDRLRRFVVAIIAWSARQAGGAGDAVAGLARPVGELIGSLLSRLRDVVRPDQGEIPGPVVGLSLEVRLDPGSLALRQVAVFPILDAGHAGLSLTAELAGFRLTLGGGFTPALVIDLREHWAALVLVPRTTAMCTLETDFWLEKGPQGEDANRNPTESAGDTDVEGKRPENPLFKLEVEGVASTNGKAPALVLAQVTRDGARFFGKLSGAAGEGAVTVTNEQGRITLRLGGIEKNERWSGSDFKLTPSVNADKTRGLLPFIKRPASGSASSGLDQYVRVTGIDFDPASTGPTVNARVGLDIKLGELETAAEIGLGLDLRTLHLKLRIDQAIDILGPPDDKSLLGMQLALRRKGAEEGDKAPFPQFRLDFTSGDMRFGLHPEASAVLRYKAIVSSGKGLEFKIDAFTVSRDGIDLTARVDPEEKVILAGVNTPFRFRSGGLSVKRSKLQAFTLEGNGQLPPALVGDVSANVAISFGSGQDGRLTVQSALGDVDRSAAPIRSHTLRFEFTLTRIGFRFVRDVETHFYFTLTGSAEFKPGPNEFQNGLLQSLSKTRITLDEVPLAADPRILLRHISFQVPIDPPARATLFSLFGFELRGIGFHPASPAFSNDPALSLSGQVSFAEFGDLPAVEIDFHQLWLAGPKPGEILPRVRMDGLGVALNLGSTARVRGTALAVDDKLPSLFRPDVLPSNIVANGFVANGALSISGLPDLSASAGFLELRKRRNGGGLEAPRHAFFLYGQLSRLSQPIPTPIGEMYLREASFGFGFRYTLAGIAQVDRVSSPQTMTPILDEVSKRQGQLSDIVAWEPEPEGDRLTLAMRMLFTLRSMSKPGGYDAEAEDPPDVPEKRKPPNPVLFDAVAAMRSDLTFLLTVRAWLSVNYADWVNGRGQAWQVQPGLRGYMYISVPRRQFLARFIGDPKGHIGNHPPLPEPLRMALTRARWSSTLYIDETVFHQEFGWPYELGFSVGDQKDDFLLICEGGLVMRFEDFSFLQGVAFRARGFARFSGQVGGSSLGAAVQAQANFLIEGKLISFISVRRLSDSFYYGALRIDVTVDFRISVWLAFRLFKRTIRFSASFVLRLTVAVAAEVVLAARTPVLGARLMVSVGVAAFGRSLRVGVGLAFNDGLIDDARARVARFMTLGLGARYPDPEVGIPAPQPAADPVARTEAGDARIDMEAERRQVVDTPVTSTDPPPEPQPGERIGRTRYWAMLFPVPRPDGEVCYVMQLLPRDLTRFVSDTDTAEGENGPNGIDDAYGGSFFASPHPEGKPVGCTVTMGLKWQAGAEPYWFHSTKGTPEPVPADGILEVVPDWEKEITTSEGDVVTFKELVADAFLPKDPKVEPPMLTQPMRQWTEVHRCFEALAPGDAAADELVRASRERASKDGALAGAAAVEERRSAIMSTVSETVARLAEAGSSGRWPSRDPVLDARDFGLTFLVSPRHLEQLADVGDGLKIRVSSWDEPSEPPIPEPGYNVALFNPPGRHFSNAPPTLRGRRVTIADGKLVLDWDLEPGWEASSTIESDPEYHLKHYSLARTLEGVEAKPFATTFKASMPLVPHPEKPGVLCLKRSPQQFIDDLSDLDDGLRAFVIKGAKEAEARRRAGLTGNDAAKIVYRVVAVDIAGTRSDVEVIEVPIMAPEEVTVPYHWVSVAFVYDRLPSFAQGWPANPKLGAPTTVPRLEIVIEDPVLDPEASQDLPPGRSSIALRLMPERIVSAGLFGIDALTDALRQPEAPPAKKPLAPLETEFHLEPGTDRAAQLKIRVTFRIADPKAAEGFVRREFDYRVASAASGSRGGRSEKPWAALLSELGIDADPNTRATRIHVRPVGDGKARPADYVRAELQLRIDTVGSVASSMREPEVAAFVENFEHPVDVTFAPIGESELDVEPGRVIATVPTADVTLRGLLDDGDRSVRRLRDPDDRAAVQLSWNARPLDLALNAGETVKDARAFAGLIGGYDVFRIDLAGLPRDIHELDDYDKAELYARHAKPIGRVQLLPRHLVGALPSETGNLAKVEAWYPSEVLRIAGDDPAMVERPANGARRHPYYSPAESLVLWPARVPRRLLLPNPDHEVIDVLFAGKRPDGLEVELHQVEQKALPRNIGLAIGLGSPTRPAVSPALDDTGVAIAGRFWIDFGKLAGVGEVRAWLKDLHWTGAADGEHPPPRAMTLRARHAGKPTGAPARVDLDLDARGPLHAVLADLVERLRFDGTARRFEPVIETPPSANQKMLSSLMDETPPQRDRYGWGILRLAGMAMSFRLYDMTAQRYLSGSDLLKQIERAFGETLAFYEPQLGDLGVPFVDVIVPPDDLLATTPFSSGTPIDGGAAVVHAAGPLAQVSLRPRAMASTKEEPNWPVRYFHFEFQAERNPMDCDEPAVTIGIPDPETDFDVLADVMVLSTGIERPVQATVASDALAERLGERSGTTRELRLPIARGERLSMLVRLLAVPHGDGDNARPLPAAKDLVKLCGAREVCADERHRPAALGGTGPDPFERFSPLSARRLRLLVGGAAGKGGHAGAKRAWDRFLDAFSWLRPTQEEEENRVLDRLGAWSARFIEHGPSNPLSGQRPVEAPEEQTPIGVALATIPRPDPWRVIPASDGKIKLLLPEECRLGKVEHYVVRPFARYDNIVQAVLPERRGPSLEGAFLPRVGGKAGPFNVFATSVLHRSAPLSAPVILAARRVGDGPAGPGRRFEVVIAQHPEQIASDANILVEAGLACREMAVGFWREFAYADWLKRLAEAVKVPPIPLDAPFGPGPAPGAVGPPTPCPPRVRDVLTPHDGKQYLTLLDEDIPDIWQGAHVLNFTGLPYGFRLHVLAYASAGVVVSPQVSTTLEEADYAVELPWTAAGIAGGEGAHGRAIRRRAAWRVFVEDGTVRLDVDLPLVRVIDGLTPVARALWFGRDEKAPALFDVPDPSVSYRLGFEVGNGRVFEAELDVVPGPAHAGDRPAAPFYTVQAIGPRFAGMGGPTAPIEVTGGAGTESRITHDEETWALRLVLPLGRPGPQPEPQRLVLADLMRADEAIGPALLATAVPGPDFPVWSWVAPKGSVTVRFLSGPGPEADRGPLKAAARNWRDLLAPYVALDAIPPDLVRTLNRIADLPDVGDPVAESLSLVGWTLGLPATPVAPITLTLDAASPLDWPELDEDRTVRAVRVVVERVSRLQPAAAEGLDRLLIAMAEASLARRERLAGGGFAGIPRHVRSLSEAEGADLGAQVEAFLEEVPDDVIDMMRSVRIGIPKGWPNGDDGRRAGFDTAIALFEGMRDAGSALQAMVGLERSFRFPSGPPEALRLLVPARRRSAVDAALKAAGFAPTWEGVTAVVLHRPPTDDGALATIKQKADARFGKEAGARFGASVREAAATQLFGPDRRLVVDAFHGLADWKRGVVERPQGGPS
jgi:hypothetical protein